MPDLTPAQVQALLAAGGLSTTDDDDLDEITHRINAVREALENLELPDLDDQKETTVFEPEEPRS